MGFGAGGGLAEGLAVEIDEGIGSDDEGIGLSAGHGGGFAAGVFYGEGLGGEGGIVGFFDSFGRKGGEGVACLVHELHAAWGGGGEDEAGRWLHGGGSALLFDGENLIRTQHGIAVLEGAVSVVAGFFLKGGCAMAEVFTPVFERDFIGGTSGAGWQGGDECQDEETQGCGHVQVEVC